MAKMKKIRVSKKEQARLAQRRAIMDAYIAGFGAGFKFSEEKK